MPNLISSVLLFLLLTLVYNPTARAQTSKAASQIEFVDEAKEIATLRPEKLTQLQNIRKSRGVKSARLVKLDEALGDSAKMFIRTNDGTELVINKKGENRRGKADFTWSGTVSGGGEATFVFKDQRVVGGIDAGGRIFEIRSLGPGLNVFVEVDRSSLPPEHPPEYPSGIFKEEQRPKSDNGTGRQAHASQVSLATPATPTIDVLVLYSPMAVSFLGEVDLEAQRAASQMNDSFTNSGVNLRVNVVAAVPIFSDFMSSSSALAGLGSTTQLGMNARVLRDRYLADIFLLIARFSDACGLARTQAASAEYAYAVVDASCLTGNLTFAHEIGHLIGAAHNVENDSTPTVGSGHGYHASWVASYTAFPAKNHTQCWHTIMSYPFSAFNVYSCGANAAGVVDKKINYWSNPAVAYTDTAASILTGFGTVAEQGPTRTLPTGAAGCCNDAALLNINGAYVASLSSTPISTGLAAARVQTIINSLLLD